MFHKRLTFLFLSSNLFWEGERVTGRSTDLALRGTVSLFPVFIPSKLHTDGVKKTDSGIGSEDSYLPTDTVYKTV